MTCALCPGKNDSPCRPTRLVQPSGLLMEGETLYVVEGLSCTHQQRDSCTASGLNVLGSDDAAQESKQLAVEPVRL